MRVATFQQISTVLQHAMKTQAKLAAVHEQQASGLKSTDYAGLGANALTVARLEVSIARSDARTASAKLTVKRTEVVDSVLGKISDILTKMRATINGVKTGKQIGELQKQAGAYLKEIAALVNTRFAGRYLFGGSLTKTPPVDLTGYKATSLTGANAGYYKGDAYVQVERVKPGYAIAYGVTGNRPGIEKAMRALSFMATASPLRTDKLKEISKLLISAQDDVISDRSINGYAANRLKTFIDTESQFSAEAGSLLTELSTVNVATAAVQAATYKTQLTVSFSAIKTLMDLNLTNYLR